MEKTEIDFVFFVQYVILSFLSLFLSFNLEKKFNIKFIILSYLIISISIILPLIYYIIQFGIYQNYLELKDMFIKGQYSAHISLIYALLLLIYDVFLLKLYLILRKNDI
jgi:uncharacterized membrane protein YbhN (UPF0104 family)